MQIKDGKIKLSKKDYRVGNFVVSEEESHVKIQDINQIMSVRVAKSIPKGQLLLAMVKERQDSALQNYIAVVYNFLCTIPDLDMLSNVNKECVACLERHKEFYGIKDEPTDEEEKAALDDVKESEEARQAFADAKKRIDAEESAKKEGGDES